MRSLRKAFRWWIALGLIGVVWAMGAKAAPVRVYVTEDGGGAVRDGTSWARAYASEDLRAAIQSADGTGGGTEVWVAEGVYVPTSVPGDRGASFVLKAGVALYGGFGGSEDQREQRDPKGHVTVLSGNVGDPATAADNSYHVVTGGADATAALDGFTVTGGRADGAGSEGCGGGMYNGSDSRSAVTACVFSNNEASDQGGGMYNANFSGPRVVGCVFTNNRTSNMGGGLFTGYQSSSEVTRCTFSDNEASYAGGGVYCQKGVSVAACTFVRNRAQFGGGIGVVGSVTVVNCTFADNVAHRGGGMSVSSSCTVTNCTFSGNRADDSACGGAMRLCLGSPRVTNCVFWNDTEGEIVADPDGGSSTPVVAYCVVQGGYDAATDAANHVVSGDPKLLGPADLGGGVATFALQEGSSAIDGGTSSGAPDTDQRGAPRPYPAGGSFDIGVFEYGAVLPTPVPVPTATPTPSPTPTPSLKRVYVTEAGGASGRDGSDWTHAWASTDLQPVLCNAGKGTQIWVAQGTYRPTTTTDRSVSFPLKSAVALYGGFAGIPGTEGSSADRDPTRHVTILSGNIGSPATSGDNSYHVVVGSGTDGTAILDGFTVTEGRADGDGSFCDGGGMYNFKGSPRVIDCFFKDNYAAFFGGGLNNEESAPSVAGCTFAGNRAEFTGGGMCNRGVKSRPEVVRCVFARNGAFMGGGMGNESGAPAVADCTFQENATPTGGSGGGMANLWCSPGVTGCTFADNTAGDSGGGMFGLSCTSELVNCTFSENGAGSNGGGVTNYDGGLVLTNCTFSGNAASAGGGLYHEGGSPRLTNSILWNGAGGEFSRDVTCSPTVTYCAIRGGYDPATDEARHVLSGDPRLLPLADNGGPTRTCAIRGDSAARDGGTSAGAPGTDQRGTGRPKGANFDMGAYEYDPSVPPDPSPSPTPVPVPTPTPSPGGATPTPWEPTPWDPPPTEGPFPSLGPTPIPRPDPAIVLPWIWVSGFDGGASLSSSDIPGPDVSRDILSSSALEERILRIVPEPVAYNTGLIRFFSVLSSLFPGTVDLAFRIRFTFGRTSPGYASEVVLLLRTFDGKGNPAGYGACNLPGDVLDPAGGTKTYVFTVRDGGRTDGDGIVNGRVAPRVAAVVVTYRRGIPPSPSSSVTSVPERVGGGGCFLGFGLPVLLLPLLASGHRGKRRGISDIPDDKGGAPR